MIFEGEPIKQLFKQLKSFYPLSRQEKKNIKNVFRFAVDDLDVCYKQVKNKYYHKDEDSFFSCYHVGQWTMFLYIMSRELYLKYQNVDQLCSKIYGLLKTVSSSDIFYQVSMPKIWFFDHPQGSVLGRADYADFFSFSQGCTVGNNKGKYPRFGEHVSMLSNSKILGDCLIGDHVIVSANCYIKDTNIPSYSIVFGSSPNLVIKPVSNEKFNELVGSMFKEGEI